jgi:hypothetical protein
MDLESKKLLWIGKNWDKLEKDFLMKYSHIFFKYAENEFKKEMGNKKRYIYSLAFVMLR